MFLYIFDECVYDSSIFFCYNSFISSDRMFTPARIFGIVYDNYENLWRVVGNWSKFVSGVGVSIFDLYLAWPRKYPPALTYVTYRALLRPCVWMEVYVTKRPYFEVYWLENVIREVFYFWNVLKCRWWFLSLWPWSMNIALYRSFVLCWDF